MEQQQPDSTQQEVSHILGRYRLRSTENFDNFLRELGKVICKQKGMSKIKCKK